MLTNLLIYVAPPALCWYLYHLIAGRIAHIVANFDPFRWTP